MPAQAWSIADRGAGARQHEIDLFRHLMQPSREGSPEARRASVQSGRRRHQPGPPRRAGRWRFLIDGVARRAREPCSPHCASRLRRSAVATAWSHARACADGRCPLSELVLAKRRAQGAATCTAPRQPPRAWYDLRPTSPRSIPSFPWISPRTPAPSPSYKRSRRCRRPEGGARCTRLEWPRGDRDQAATGFSTETAPEGEIVAGRQAGQIVEDRRRRRSARRRILWRGGGQVGDGRNPRRRLDPRRSSAILFVHLGTPRRATQGRRPSARGRYAPHGQRLAPTTRPRIFP